MMKSLPITPLSLLSLIPLSLAQSPNNQSISIVPIGSLTPSLTTYLADPWIIPHNSPGIYLSGTTPKYLFCPGPLSSSCAASQPVHNLNYTSTASLSAQMTSHNAKTCFQGNHQPVQDRNGTWHMAVTLRMYDIDAECVAGTDQLGQLWHVVAHARPEDEEYTGDAPPASWVGDSVLVGSFGGKDVRGNYDGKYYRAGDGALWLLFEKEDGKDEETGKGRNGVAAVKMRDYTTKEDEDATFLLRSDKGLNSQLAHSKSWATGTGSKVIETGNVREIGGKFVMTYSTGTFQEETYKTGLAWSDTFLPADAETGWRKVMKENPNGLYDSTGEKEAYYLLQSDNKNETGWNYVGDRVLSPGVATVVDNSPEGEEGTEWVLVFCGFDASQEVKPTTRRPYYVELDVNVPKGTSVEEASDEELRGWIQPRYS